MERIKRYWLGALALLVTSSYAVVTFVLDLPGRIESASSGLKWIYNHQNSLTPLVLVGVIAFVLIRERSKRNSKAADEEESRSIKSEFRQIQQKLEIAEDEVFALSVLSYLTVEEQEIVRALSAYAVRWAKFEERVNNGEFVDLKSEGQFQSAAKAGYQFYDTLKRIASARLDFSLDNVDIGHIGAPYSPQSKLANERMLKDYQDEWLRNARREIRSKALMKWISNMKQRASNIIAECARAALSDERYTKSVWRGVVSVRGRMSMDQYHENQALAAIEALKNLKP